MSKKRPPPMTTDRIVEFDINDFGRSRGLGGIDPYEKELLRDLNFEGMEELKEERRLTRAERQLERDKRRIRMEMERQRLMNPYDTYYAPPQGMVNPVDEFSKGLSNPEFASRWVQMSPE